MLFSLSANISLRTNIYKINIYCTAGKNIIFSRGEICRSNFLLYNDSANTDIHVHWYLNLYVYMKVNQYSLHILISLCLKSLKLDKNFTVFSLTH